MPNIILGCTVWAVVLYCVTAAMGLGWIPAENETHRLTGIFTAVFAVTAQGLAFTLGIAWARIITEGAKALVLPQELGDRARRAMMRIDLLAMLAMSGVIAAAVMGGAVDTGSLGGPVHGWFSAGALVLLVAAFGVQFRDFTALRGYFDEARAKLESAAKEAAIAEAEAEAAVNGRT